MQCNCTHRELFLCHINTLRDNHSYDVLFMSSMIFLHQNILVYPISVFVQDLQQTDPQSKRIWSIFNSNVPINKINNFEVEGVTISKMVACVPCWISIIEEYIFFKFFLYDIIQVPVIIPSGKHTFYFSYVCP